MPAPVPGTPIVTLCRRDLIETVAAIGTVSGFQTDVPSVESPEPGEGTDYQLFKCIVVSRGEEPLTEGMAQGHDESRWNWNLEVTIYKPASVTEETLDDLFELSYADIRRAVLTDRVRGGMALDTVVQGWTPADDRTGISVSGYCEVRTLEASPNQQS